MPVRVRLRIQAIYRVLHCLTPGPGNDPSTTLATRCTCRRRQLNNLTEIPRLGASPTPYFAPTSLNISDTDFSRLCQGRR